MSRGESGNAEAGRDVAGGAAGGGEGRDSGAGRLGAGALFAVVLVGLACFMLASPAFPLTPRLFDALVPGVNMSVFTVAAGCTVVVVAVVAGVRAARGGALPHATPARAAACGMLYLVVLGEGFAFMPAFQEPAAAVAGGVALGLGMAAAFFAWGCAASALAGRVRSLGAVLGSLALALACATGINMALVGRAASLCAAVVAVAVVLGVAVPVFVLALEGTARPSSDRATFGELVAMGVAAGEERPPARAAAAVQVLLPVAVLLLYVASQVLSRSIEGNHALEAYGVLAAAVLAAAPLAVRDDSRRVAFALRVLLPLFGVAVLGAAVIAPDAIEAVVASLGAQSLCYAYGTILLALVAYFALARAAGMLPLVALMAAAALGIVMLLPHLTLTPAVSTALPVFLAVLVATLCLLAASPSFSAWSGAFSLASASRQADGQTLEQKVQAACDAVADAYALSPREREILHYLGRGYGPRYLATVLPIKENTIRSHVRNIYAKTDVHTQPDLLVLIDSYAE